MYLVPGKCDLYFVNILKILGEINMIYFFLK